MRLVEEAGFSIEKAHYFDLAGISWNMDEPELAFSILDTGIKFAKENFRNFVRYAEFHYEQGNKNMCINYLSIAINTNPSTAMSAPAKCDMALASSSRRVNFMFSPIEFVFIKSSQ